MNNVKHKVSRSEFKSEKDSLIKELEAIKTNSWFMRIDRESEILQRSIDYLKNNYGNTGAFFMDISYKTDVAIRNTEITGRDLFDAYDFRYSTYKKESHESDWYEKQAEASEKICPEWDKMINILISHIRSIVQQLNNIKNENK